MTFKYSIEQFAWVKDRNTFYADAWNLIALNEQFVGREAFSNSKQHFCIVNYQTEGFRRFTFLKDEVYTYEDDPSLNYTAWVFTSEDGIRCEICVTL